jgi:hypothetical protein
MKKFLPEKRGGVKARPAVARAGSFCPRPLESTDRLQIRTPDDHPVAKSSAPITKANFVRNLSIDKEWKAMMVQLAVNL